MSKDFRVKNKTYALPGEALAVLNEGLLCKRLLRLADDKALHESDLLLCGFAHLRHDFHWPQAFEY